MAFLSKISNYIVKMSLTNDYINKKIQKSYSNTYFSEYFLGNLDALWEKFVNNTLEPINASENIDLGGHNPKKIYKNEEQIDENKSKFNIQVPIIFKIF